MNKPIKPKKGGKQIYDDALKIAVAREYLKGELGYIKLARKYNLPNEFTAAYFVKWYKASQLAAPNAPASPAADQGQQPPATSQEAALRKQLADAHLHIAALQTMIAIADKEFGISITKKPGTKQSKP